MKLTIGALFLYNSYFIDVMEDYLVKIKRKRKFHLMISESLKNFFFDHIVPNLILKDDMIEDQNNNLDFKIQQYTLDNIDEFRLKLREVSPQCFLF